MRILLDTTILLRLSSHQDQGRSVLGQLVTQLGREHNLYVVPQCVYEMWSVMTRPVNANGWGLSPEQVAQEVERLLDTFPFLPDTPQVFGQWLDLVTRYEVSGRPSHDARLAAAMQVHDLDTLLTLNAADFKRYGLKVLTPADL